MRVVGRKRYVVAVLVTLLLPSPAIGAVNPALVGARIDEALATSLIYVNPAAAGASDANPGTQSLPVVTIGRGAQLAIEANRTGLGVRVRIASGTYRESIRLEGTSSATAAPIIFEAITHGSVIVSGSDIWTGWIQGNPAGTYVHQWPHTWGLVPIPAGWECCVVLPDLMRRREMVFVNGQRLRQVLSVDLLAPSTFYVSESSQQIRISPAAGVNIDTATVEVAERSSLVLIQNRSNIVIRGIGFRHDNNAVGGTAALTIYNASNILVEDSSLDWNNYRGLAIADTSRVTVRRTSASFNGSVGISGWKMRSTLFEDADTSYNNWRGFESGFTDWDTAGTKLMLLHNAALVRQTLVGNQAYGLWLDTDCVDVLVQGMVSSENLNDGVFLEAIQGPVNIESSRMTKNGRSGLLIANAAAGTMSGSILVDNRESQVLISGNPAGRPVENFETGQRYAGIQSTDWSFKSNTLHAGTAAQTVTSTTLPPALWQTFVDTLVSDWNSWYNPGNLETFRWVNGLPIDFSGWKTRTRQDQHSVFSSSQGPRPPVNVRFSK